MLSFINSRAGDSQLNTDFFSNGDQLIKQRRLLLNWQDSCDDNVRIQIKNCFRKSMILQRIKCTVFQPQQLSEVVTLRQDKILLSGPDGPNFLKMHCIVR